MIEKMFYKTEYIRLKLAAMNKSTSDHKNLNI